MCGFGGRQFWCLIAFGQPELLPPWWKPFPATTSSRSTICALGEILPSTWPGQDSLEYLTGRREQLAYREYVAGLAASAEM